MKSTDVLRRWSIGDSLETYAIRNWGSGYFSINEKGNLIVHPGGEGTDAIDLKELVDELAQRGLSLPLLIRFTDILRARIEMLNECFRRAIQEYGYKGSYKGVYPIKVNQDRHVVEQIVNYGRPYGYGLEAGSKPELLAVMAMLDSEEALIICNGYKDEEYIETALLAAKLGRTVILVVEKPSELQLIREVSTKMGVRPSVGIRAKLSSRGSGRWESSGGDRSKFGLSAREMLDAVSSLTEWNMLDCFQLLHFHLGSQISSIRSIKNALREAGRFYVELAKMGASLRYLDVGGGLGVDYDGSQTNFASSMNYTVQEYANDIVYSMMEMCDAEGVAHPTIVSESGRAAVAHHAVLAINILGVHEFADDRIPEKVPDDAEPILRNLFDTYRDVSRKNFLEAYHDAVEYKDECLSLFSLGHLSLEQRVMAESLFWGICQKSLRIIRELDHTPEELEGLEKVLSDTYFCNFSMFQSLPDSWAVDQLFPIVPLHRHNETPSRRAVLADITCDSDGKIDSFIDLHDVKHTLELHPIIPGQEYHLGIFLVGAYQEILGDLHNLFGDTNTVHVSLDGEGGYRIDHVVTGDAVTDVLKYVSYNKEELVARVRRYAEMALRAKRMTLEESRQLLKMYDDGLAGYTYLER
ncbi:MAG: biosynthetic arginine decarboxylase [Deltaproteobacteria bacterium]|nr:biosynthetic arginine decarboxylase [Deltaproteobacteria bacterium]